MSNEKPLAEILTGVYANELHKMYPEVHSPWENMNERNQQAHLGAMHAVVELFHGFGLEVVKDDKGIRLTTREKLSSEKETEKVLFLPPRPETAPTAEDARLKGYTGIPCDMCGGLYTIRSGKCLQCAPPPLGCGHSGECG